MLQASTQLVVVVQLLSHVRLLATPWGAAHQASLSFTVLQSLLKLMSIESMMPSNHLVLCHPLLLLSSIFLSIIVFSNKLAPKNWSFSFSINPSNEYLGLISFRIDWFDILAVQGILRSSPTTQFENINSSLALSLLYGTVSIYMTTWRRKWQPTPVFSPGEFHGQRSLAGHSPWGCKVGHS